jgi:hypothetical protein
MQGIRSAGSADDRRRVIAAGTGATLVISGAAMFWMARKLTFFSDEWVLIATRLDWSADAVLRPHNEHLMAVPVLAYKILFATVGIERYWPYLALAIAVHLLCVVLLFAYAERRHGTLVAACVALPVLFFGPGHDVVLWPMNLGFSGSVAAGLGALLLLDRRSPRADAAACALVIVAEACSSVGVAVALGVLVGTLLGPEERRRAWIAAVPLALYALWRVAYAAEIHRQGEVHLAAAPGYLAHAAIGTVGALAGAPLGLETGAPRALVAASAALTALALGTAAWRLASGRTPLRRVLTPVAILAAYLTLLGIFRAWTHHPYGSRYLYPAAFFSLVIAVELGPVRRLRGPAVAVLAAVVTVAGVLNAMWLRKDARRMTGTATILRAELGALDTVRAQVGSRFRVRRTWLVAPQYFEAIDRLGGTPAFGVGEILAAPDYARRAADGVLRRSYGRPVPAHSPAGQLILAARGLRGTRGGPPGLLPTAESGVVVRRDDGCLQVRPTASRGWVDLRLPEAGLVVDRRGIAVTLRRFAARHAAQPAWVTRNGTVFPGRHAGRPPWRADVVASRPFKVC